MSTTEFYVSWQLPCGAGPEMYKLSKRRSAFRFAVAASRDYPSLTLTIEQRSRKGYRRLARVINGECHR